MGSDRDRLALLLTSGVQTADWERLAGEDVRGYYATPGGLAALGARLGRPLGPVDWEAVDRQEAALARCGARTVCVWDDAYPARLRNVYGAPAVLFVRGNAGLAEGPAVALVGTRKPSGAGATLATRLARSLAQLGVTVVSGLARGIDTAAHRGALDVGGGTIAVLGTGVDVVYPPENGEIMERVASLGCLVSEQLFGTPAVAHVFPRRNRIISGLCDAVVVIQGGERSGALITARWALEQGREVGAVPGFPGDFRSTGPNRLLREGAFLVEDAGDVIANVPSLARALAVTRAPREGEDASLPAGCDDETARVYDVVVGEVTADEVACSAGVDVGRAQQILSRLEIDGHVVRDDANRFMRATR